MPRKRTPRSVTAPGHVSAPTPNATTSSQVQQPQDDTAGIPPSLAQTPTLSTSATTPILRLAYTNHGQHLTPPPGAATFHTRTTSRELINWLAYLRHTNTSTVFIYPNPVFFYGPVMKGRYLSYCDPDDRECYELASTLADVRRVLNYTWPFIFYFNNAIPSFEQLQAGAVNDWHSYAVIYNAGDIYIYDSSYLPAHPNNQPEAIQAAMGIQQQENVPLYACSLSDLPGLWLVGKFIKLLPGWGFKVNIVRAGGGGNRPGMEACNPMTGKFIEDILSGVIDWSVIEQWEIFAIP